MRNRPDHHERRRRPAPARRLPLPWRAPSDEHTSRCLSADAASGVADGALVLSDALTDAGHWSRVGGAGVVEYQSFATARPTGSGEGRGASRFSWGGAATRNELERGGRQCAGGALSIRTETVV